MPANSAVVPPGGTLGIFGGGQLGRMVAMAARSFGYRVVVLDPDPDCPAKAVADRCFTAQFDDVDAARELAAASDLVTLEIEKVSVDCLQAAAERVPVRPGATVLGLVQDRARQKCWLVKHGFPLGPWYEAADLASLTSALERSGSAFVKLCQGGYDGRGQSRGTGSADAARIWAELGAGAAGPVVVEQGLDLELELSVMVARRPSGETATFPPAYNRHEERILHWSVLPGQLPPELAVRAQVLAREIAEALQIEGLLAVEFFLTRSGQLLVNELAPRPHNSFHATERACITSQFEQAVRAVCNLPLGLTEAVRSSAIVNLLGDLWIGPDGSPIVPDFSAALAIPGIRLHLYGKQSARPGRKMGHLSSVGLTANEALERCQAAAKLL